MKTQKRMIWPSGRKQRSLARQFLFALGSIAILTLVLAIFSGLTFKNLNDEFADVERHAKAQEAAGAMAIAVQYNAHDTNAFMLGHLEHENEFVEHRADFVKNLNVFQQTDIAGDLDLVEVTSKIDRLSSLREPYDAASTALFSTYREWLTLGSEIDTTWAEVDSLGDEMDDLSNVIVAEYENDPALIESALRMAVTVQYNAHDVNAYLLGHAEHRQEFIEHSEQFTQALADAEERSGDLALQAQLAELKRLRAAYDEGSQALFDLFDARVTLQEQLDQQWETADSLGDDLDGLAVEVRDVLQSEMTEAQTRVNTTFRTSLIVLSITAGLALVLSIGIAIGLSRKISRSLTAVVDAATAITAGDLSQRVEVTSRDELGDLASTFNQMIAYMQQMAEAANHLAQGDVTVDVTPQSDRDVLGQAFSQMIVNLRNLVGQAQQSAEQVAEASQQLNSVAEQASRASQQVSTTIQQVSQGTNQQTQAITEATSNVEQIANAAGGIARGSQEQAQSVQKTSDLIDEMANSIEAVAQTGQGLEAIRSRTTVTVEKVREMEVRSREIGRIVETIDEIADKTDMLALNAAVEAARAGEHGRGFAVVADQVRKLSEDSKQATRDIGDLIERVQETVDEAIAVTESTAADVDSGTRRIEEAVSQLKEKSADVVAAVEAVSTVVEENTATAEEMAANSQEVTSAMEGVAGIAEENSASAEQVSASAEEMSAQVEEVVASSEELSALAEELRAATAQFRVDGTEPEPLVSSPETSHVPASQPQPEPVAVLADRQGNSR